MSKKTTMPFFRKNNSSMTIYPTEQGILAGTGPEPWVGLELGLGWNWVGARDGGQSRGGNEAWVRAG